MIIRTLLLTVATLAASSVNAWTYYLERDAGVEGLVRNCEYTDGSVYTVNAVELCPLTIEDSGPSAQSSAHGVLSSEYQDGMTKVCIYNVMGNEKALRVGAAHLCPLTAEF